MIRFPEGTPLHYHSFAYPKVFAIAMLSKATGTELSSLLLLQNINLLVSFPLAGVGAFYLVRHFTRNGAGALTGGFVFAFNPSHVAHVMHHAGVSSIEFIPFFVLSYLVAMERRRIMWLGLAIVFYVLSALSSWYYFFFIAYFMAFHAVYTIIHDRAFLRGWSLLNPIACLACVVLLLSPLLIPMVKAAMGPSSVYAGGSNFFVADVFGYVLFPPVHLLGDLTKDLNSRLTGNPWEATVYLGFVNLVLMTWLCFRFKQTDRRLLTYVLSGMAVFCMLASGAFLHVLGNSILPMPGALLAVLPLFDNLRVPSRAIVFVYLFLAIGVGHAVSLVWQHRHRPPIRWGLVPVAALMVLDFYPHHLAITPVSCPPGLALIRDDPDRGFGILNLPGGRIASEAYMLQQICHRRPIVQGETSRDMVVTLRDRLETGNLEAQLRQLSAAKIKYIVISPPTGELFWWRGRDGQQADYFGTYPIVYNGPDVTILRVY